MQRPESGNSRVSCRSIVATGLLLVVPVLCFAEEAADTRSAPRPEEQGILEAPKEPSSLPERQFLNRGNWRGYLNYGKEAYETGVVSARSFELYDRLGQRLLRGYPLVTWQQAQSDSLELRASNVFRSSQFWQWFDSFVILHDTYEGWDVGVLIGDNIQTTLTPLTLARARWDGVRVDAESKRYGLTFLSTRGQSRHYSSFQTMADQSPVIQYGGRCFGKIGGVLSAGLTYFNQHQMDLEIPDASLLHGDLPYPMEAPSQILVRVEDDSPLDGNPAGAYEVHVDVEVRREDGSWETRTSESDPAPGRTYSPTLRPSVSGRRVGDHWEAEGSEEAIDFGFRLPAGQDIRSARFRAKVAGDYRIGVCQLHPYWNSAQFAGEGVTIGPRWEDRYWPSVPMPQSHNLVGRSQYPIDFGVVSSSDPVYDIEFDASDPKGYRVVTVEERRPTYTVRRAEGSPDLSTVALVAFDYGIPVGQTLIGGDIEIAARGLALRGELVYNVQEHQFPFANDSLRVRGKRSTLDALAGYVNVTKGLRLGAAPVLLGGEAFRIDPDYSGGYDSRRGGVVLFTDRNAAYVEIKKREGRLKAADRVYHGATQEFDLVSDNDDADDWPDDWPEDEGRFQPRSPQFYSGAKGHSGVFPGLDEDGDGTPDTDRDRDGVADWTQPFLMYESDAPEFEYGLDMNNNGVPDRRENDAVADYPYSRDCKGYHAFAKLAGPLSLVDLVSVGYYGISQVAGWGRAKGPYARLEMSGRPAGRLDVRFKDDVKYVRDTIRDDVYVFDISSDSTNVGSALFTPPPDSLVMKRSLANRAFLGLAMKLGRGPNLRLDTMHFTNQQYEAAFSGGERQSRDLFTEVATVARADYERRWGDLKLWTGFKYALREGDRRSQTQPASSVRLRAPMFRVGYAFTPNVGVQVGVSGIPGLPLRYKDRVDPTQSYRQQNAVAMISAFTDNYLGYNVALSMGIQRQFTDFDRGGKERDYDTFGFFVESFLGN